MCLYLILYGISTKSPTCINFLILSTFLLSSQLSDKTWHLKKNHYNSDKKVQTAHVYLQFLDTRLIYKCILHILTHILVTNILEKKNFCFSPYFKYKQAEPLRSWVMCPKLHRYWAELGIKPRNCWPWVQALNFHVVPCFLRSSHLWRSSCCPNTLYDIMVNAARFLMLIEMGFFFSSFMKSLTIFQSIYTK